MHAQAVSGSPRRALRVETTRKHLQPSGPLAIGPGPAEFDPVPVRMRKSSTSLTPLSLAPSSNAYFDEPAERVRRNRCLALPARRAPELRGRARASVADRPLQLRPGGGRMCGKFQKRKRNPTVGSMLLRWRKPLANPPFTRENMRPT